MYINKAFILGNLTRDPEVKALPIGQYVRKGGSLYVEGRLQTRSWEKDGEKRYRTEIVVENFQFGPRATGAGERGASDSFAAPAKDDQKFSPASEIESIDYPDEAINSEDIPF